MKALNLSLTALLIAGAAALAQPAFAVELPAICTKDAGMAGHHMDSMGGGAAMSGMAAPDQPHQDLMAGMDEMNRQMMEGSTAADIDVAFVCAMIPHHQGAIDMAKAELAHGDDDWARGMAQKIIDAQEQEINEMLDWLGKQPQ